MNALEGELVVMITVCVIELGLLLRGPLPGRIGHSMFYKNQHRYRAPCMNSQQTLHIWMGNSCSSSLPLVVYYRLHSTHRGSEQMGECRASLP